MSRKVIIIGLGSLGKRRIRLMKQIDEKLVIFGVDSREDRRKEAEELYDIKSYADMKDALTQDYDCAFICTSPLSHANLITLCLENNLHVFTEINLVTDRYEENIKLAEEKGKLLFISSTFLYRDEIKFIQKEVRESKSLLSYTYHIGQYLPDWHPWEKYTEYFIGDSRTNGCREIMAIDFPWIYKTFGKVVDIQVKKNKKTKLKTTYNDSYLLLLEHENGIQGTIMVDVVSRKAVRNLEIYGEDLYITWDGSVTGLKKYNIETKTEVIIELYEIVDKQEGYASFVVENAYRNEITSFFDKIETPKDVVYGFEEDKYVLNLIDEIENVGD